MSKQEKHNRTLHDLLNNGNGQVPEDAFEKEAREGFELLGNASEAYELKAATDARVSKELFAPKRERNVFYSVAAASVLLFVGFAVYFFSDFSQTHQPLAINRQEVKKETAQSPAQAQV